MLLVKPSFEMLTLDGAPFTQADGVCMLRSIEEAGRTCYKSTSDLNVESAIVFAKKLIQRDHLSVIEHCAVRVVFIIDRGVSHELVRHRLCSFSQESTRYCDYADGHITFVIPSWCGNLQAKVYESQNDITQPISNAEEEWLIVMTAAERAYQHFRKGHDWSPQQARSVLPNSLKTEIVVTANLREWRHIFRLRCAESAHPQMREVMCPLLVEFQKKIPILFDKLNV